jgi:CHAD domain-containing protein
MAKRFKPTRKRIEKQFRAIARERLDHALDALDGGAPPGEALHKARTEVKRLRGQFKLARPAFKAHRGENAALRDAARAVSGLRDDTAMLKTFDRLAVDMSPDEIRVLAPVRSALTRASPRPEDTAAQVAVFRHALAAARGRTRAWKVSGHGFKPLGKGLSHTYEAARRAMYDSRSQATPAAFHEWRKSVKAHWYQARLLAAIAPKKMAPHVALAGELGELLGEHHDLVTFPSRLESLDIAPAVRDRMKLRLEAERRRIEARAFALGERLLDEEPGTLARRWKRRWDKRAA